MIYLFDKDEKLIKIVRKSAVKTALQKYALTTERYVSDRLTVELKGLNADELEQVEYMAIQTMEDAHAFHYFYVAQKFSDELTTLIGVQSGIEELRKSPVYDKRPNNALARDVITDLLNGTNWQARFVGETTPHSTNFYYTSIFDALKKVCEVWDLEMQFFVEMNGNQIGARYIDFKQRIGQAVGKRVVYGHNALQILQEVERTNIFTALIGRGKGEETGDGYGRKITFENVVWSRTQGKPVDKPKGQKYLELPLMTRQYGIKNADGSMRPKIGFVDFSEEENPEILIERTYRALIDAARPQLTLKTSSVYLRGVKVGDTIRVVRHDKKLDYDTRIFEITFNRLNNQSSDIKLGDRIGESNEAKVQTIADKAVEQFVNNEFSNFVQNLPDYLPSADGFNNNWYGAEDPTVQYPGKVLINDIWFKPDPEHEGHKIMLRWTGEVWEEILRTYDSESLRDRIAEEIAQVNQSIQAQAQEHDRQVANILSKTQSVESLANQAKADAANVAGRLDETKTDLQNSIYEAKLKVETVSRNLENTRLELSNGIGQADAKANTIAEELKQAKLTLIDQVKSQTELKHKVSTVEELANGTKMTVTQLTKSVNGLTGELTGATQTIKSIEDGIEGVYTTLSKITLGGINLFSLKNITNRTEVQSNGFYYVTSQLNANAEYTVSTDIPIGSDGYAIAFVFPKGGNPNTTANGISENKPKTILTDSSGKLIVAIRNKVWFDNVVNGKNHIQIETGSNASSWQPSFVDTSTELAEYKQAVDGQLIHLNRAYATLDGKIAENNVIIQTTVNGIKEDMKSVRSYVDAEGTRRTEYLTASELKTAELISKERTKIALDYVAKSVYTEDISGTERRLSATEIVANSATTGLATYKESNDKRVSALEKSTSDATGILTNLSNRVEQDARKTVETLTALETKIPTEFAGGNLILNGGFPIDTTHWSGPLEVAKHATYYSGTQSLFRIKSTGGEVRVSTNRFSVKRNTTYTISFYVLIGGNVTSVDFFFLGRKEGESDSFTQIVPLQRDKQNNGSRLEYITYTFNSRESDTGFIRFDNNGSIDGYVANMYIAEVMLVEGSVPRKYEKSVSEVSEEISNAKLEIAKTAEGLKLTATKTELTNARSALQSSIESAKSTADSAQAQADSNTGTISQHSLQLTAINNELSSKVSTSDYNTLTGRMSNAESAITQNATEISKRLTSTQVESAITGKGYQTKSQVDNNITGRGYITSNALQPYALSTTVQTLVKETADSFSRTISETKALIPSDAVNRNLLNTNDAVSGTILFGTETYPNPSSSNIHPNNSTIKTAIWVDAGSKYTFSKITKSGKDNFWRVSYLDSNYAYVDRFAREENVFTITIPANAKYLWVSYPDDAQCKIEKGDRATPFVLSVNDTATVTALHTVNDTVDSHTRTIGAVGESGTLLDNVSRVIQTANGLVSEVQGAGGLKTQVSQLNNSYAIKNLTSAGTILGQLNLNTDGSIRLNDSLISIGDKTYIKNGIIKSAMIGNGQIGTAHIGTIDAAIANIINLNVNRIVGLDANFIKAKIETAMIDWMRGKTIIAQNDAMTINLNQAGLIFRDNAKIEFQSENNTLYRTKNGTSAFIHFRDDSYNGVYTAMGVNADNTGTQNDYSSGAFAGVRVIRSNPSRYSGTTVDQVQLVGDEIRMRHGYGYENDYLVAKWDGGPKIDLMAWLRQFNTNFAHLINITGRGDVIKTF